MLEIAEERKKFAKRPGVDIVIDEGFEELYRHKDKHIKILISPRW